MRPRRILLSLCFLLLAPQMSHAFPETIRHGYTSCLACHVSPNGGNLLTPYGRGLSEAMLSTWKSNEEGQFLYGSFKTPSFVQAGGDVRVVQTYRDSATARDLRFTFMQAELEAAAGVNPIQFVGAIGITPPGKDQPVRISSPRHYLLVHASDAISIRAGKFMRAYGINQPEHEFSVRRRLGFTPASESYHLEASYRPGSWEHFATLSVGEHQGFTLRSGINFESAKVGFSYAYLVSSEQKSHQTGPWGIVALSKRLLVSSEIDFIFREDKRTNMRASVATTKLDYEWFDGIHSYVLHDADWARTGEAAHTFGIGLQFFPRPHFEFNALYLRSFLGAAKSLETFLMVAHYYL